MNPEQAPRSYMKFAELSSEAKLGISNRMLPYAQVYGDWLMLCDAVGGSATGPGCCLRLRISRLFAWLVPHARTEVWFYGIGEEDYVAWTPPVTSICAGIDVDPTREMEFAHAAVVFHLDMLLLPKGQTGSSEVSYQSLGEASSEDMVRMMPRLKPLEKLEPDDRAQILDEILVILAGVGAATPETTYKQDGGFSLALADLKRALQEGLTFKVELQRANDALRSAHAVAERKGAETNWPAFTALIKRILDDQHKLIHPTT